MASCRVVSPAFLTPFQEKNRPGFETGQNRSQFADDSVSAIISTCLINLSADKSRVFRESFRVLMLKPGGRLASIEGAAGNGAHGGPRRRRTVHPGAVETG